MALLSDFEPPSSQTNEPRNQKLHQSNLIGKITNFGALKIKLVFFVTQTSILCKIIQQFYKNNVKFLPHFAIIFLLALVLTSNLTESAMADSLYVDFATANPDEEFAIAREADRYTPLIGSDQDLLDNYLSAQATSDGFAINALSASTQLTLRTEPLPDNSAGEITYIVKAGDALSGIAMIFDVKTSTIKYVNNLETADVIKPGMKLKIPKKGYEVSSTLIAKREAEIAAKRNRLAIANRNTVARDSGRTASVNYKPGSSRNAYPYGWCTYYVATRRYVPGGWGNARSWLSSARRDGYATGRAPVAGAIMVSSESWLGHVSYVESVNGDGTFTISEMNARGWGVTSSRRIRNDYGRIMGFVY